MLRLACIASNIVADDLAALETGASLAMVQTYFVKNITFSAE